MVLCLAGGWIAAGPAWAQSGATQPGASPGPAPGAGAEVPTTPADDAAAVTPELACMKAHEQAQVLRLDGNLMQSRSALKACSLEECPAVLQRDCVRWLDEVSTQIPTVVFEAITEAGAAQRVVVKQKEQVLTRELDGRPLEMNPGYYEFRFELPGRAPKLVPVLLKQGEKNRLVSVDFRREPDPAAQQSAATPPPPVPPPAPSPAETVYSRPIPTSVYVLGGVSLVSAGAAAILGINTSAKEDRAYEECAPRCPEERIDSIERWALATDVSIGVSVVTAIAATILYVRRPVVTENAPTGAAQIIPSFGWQQHAGWAGVEGSFW